MKIIESKTVVKLDKEERDNLIETISFFEQMDSTFQNIECCICPFKLRCDERSKDICLLNIIQHDLIYIKNNCD